MIPGTPTVSAGGEEGKGGSGQSDSSASRSISRPLKSRKSTGIPNITCQNVILAFGVICISLISNI